MQLKIDTSRTYAIALEGGGAKGGYQIGVWRALEQAGVKYNAVAGSSVGAINGALMAMREPDRAAELWESISYSKIMDVDDGLMEKLYTKDFRGFDIRMAAEQLVGIFRDGGFDVTPLRRWMAEVVDEEKLRASDVELFIKTFSLTDMKELDIDVKKLPAGQICDMLLASAYFPAFKNEKLGGKRYTDGGIQDAVPVNSLLSRGYRDVIAVRIFGFGKEKRVHLPEGARVITIEPTVDLGGLLDFSSERAKRNMALGYFDAQRMLYGLEGREYYIERTWSERQAYDRLVEIMSAGGAGLREVNESLLPRLARKLGSKSDYYALLLDYMELAGDQLEVPALQIRTDEELFCEIMLYARGRVAKKLKPELRSIIEYSRSDR